jgi:hypothetical protein
VLAILRGVGSWRSCAAGLLATAALLGACDAVTAVVVQGASFGGATANAHCDRRYVDDGGQPSAFCQEVVGTVAAAQFADDCREEHRATAGPGLCPRPGIIAGCQLEAKTGDGSLVWDWYYDIEGFPALDADGGAYFAPPDPQDASAVGQTCADPSRYPGGAELVYP